MTSNRKNRVLQESLINYSDFEHKRKGISEREELFIKQYDDFLNFTSLNVTNDEFRKDFNSLEEVLSTLRDSCKTRHSEFHEVK